MKQLRRLKAKIGQGRAAIKMQRQLKKMLEGLCPSCFNVMRVKGNDTTEEDLCEACAELIREKTGKMAEAVGGVEKLKEAVSNAEKDTAKQ